MVSLKVSSVRFIITILVGTGGQLRMKAVFTGGTIEVMEVVLVSHLDDFDVQPY